MRLSSSGRDRLGHSARRADALSAVAGGAGCGGSGGDKAGKGGQRWIRGRQNGLACAWVANLIHAEIMDAGAAKIADAAGTDSPEDEQRLADALRELAAELKRRGAKEGKR